MGKRRTQEDDVALTETERDGLIRAYSQRDDYVLRRMVISIRRQIALARVPQQAQMGQERLAILIEVLESRGVGVPAEEELAPPGPVPGEPEPEP